MGSWFRSAAFGRGRGAGAGRLGLEEQVAPEERDLVRDDRLVLRPVVDVEVGDVRVGLYHALGARLPAAIAGPGSATLSASPTHTSHGQCRVSAWWIVL